MAVISANDGPPDGVILERHSDTKAIVRQPLAIDYLPGCLLLVRGSYGYAVTRLPTVFGEQASAVCADVIGARFLFRNGTGTFDGGEAHHDDDREPPLDSAAERLV